MRNAAPFIVSLSTVALIAVCSLWADQTQAPQAGPVSATVPAPVTLPRSVAAPAAKDGQSLRQLQRQVDDLYERQDELEQAVGPTPAGDPALASEEDAEARDAASAAKLEAALDGEAPDPGWSAAAEDTLREWTLERSGVQLQESRCSASLCRVVMGFDDVRTRSEVMRSMPHQGPWQAEGFGHPLDEAGLVYEVYLAREGRSLPSA